MCPHSVRRRRGSRRANEALPGQLAVESMPSHYEEAVTLVTEDMVAESTPVGPDPERWVAAIEEVVDAGFDEVYIRSATTRTASSRSGATSCGPPALRPSSWLPSSCYSVAIRLAGASTTTVGPRAASAASPNPPVRTEIICIPTRRAAATSHGLSPTSTAWCGSTSS
ncbi:hypothetical protein BH23ACT10_BH23ACT10_40290 [soil metagenome]